MPSLPRALIAKRQVDEILKGLVCHGPQPDDVDLAKELSSRTSSERQHTVSTLLSLHEADHARIRGLESKAIATLQLIGIILAGNLAAIALVSSNGKWDSVYAACFSVLSGLYLTSALAGALMVTRPGTRFTLNTEPVLPAEAAAMLLVQYTRQNRIESLNRSNLTRSAIDDAARAYFMVIVALILAVI